MATKRATTKRKASSDSDIEDQGKSSKKPKLPTVTAPTSSQPHSNKILPTVISFVPPTAGTLKIVTWNVAGLAACQKKGFKKYVEAENPDVLVLTETKVNNPPVDPFITSRFPHAYWSIAAQKGYAGTAVLSKHKPLKASYDLPLHPDPQAVKGRLITLEFQNYWLVATYVVNAGEKLKMREAKETWNDAFTKYLRQLDSTKPVIWTGDVNCAPTAKDVTDASRHWNKTPGHTDFECRAFANILTPAEESPTNDIKPGHMVDIWRELHPEDEHYTFFSYRHENRVKGRGWRLDMFVLSERIAEKAKKCEIRTEIWGASDHCPVMMELEGEQL